MKQVLFPTVLGFLVLAATQPALAATSVDSTPTVDRDGSIHSGLSARIATNTSTGDRANPSIIAQSDNPVAQDDPVTQDTPPASSPISADPNTGALNFNPPGATAIASTSSASDTATSIITPSSSAPPSPSPRSPSPSPSSTKDLFANGSDSLVARVVGAAEGTRNPDGSPTSLYEGHRDPGNGVWNRGTFSYQFGNAENLSPEEADQRQIAKIKRIYESVLRPQAQQHGLDPLTLLEELNGIDLINQAPRAVTESGGYIERLAEAKQKKGLSGEEAILEARVWSFWDPQRNGWDAPGLRAYDDLGKEASIRHDQKRRMGMIDRALNVYQQQHGAIAQTPPAPQPQHQKMVAQGTKPQPQKRSDPAQIADLIIFNHS